MDSRTVNREASAAGASESEAWTGEVLALFQHLLSAEFFFLARQKAGVAENHRVYTSAVLMWLMIWQRLQQGYGTLEGAV